MKTKTKIIKKKVSTPSNLGSASFTSHNGSNAFNQSTNDSNIDHLTSHLKSNSINLDNSVKLDIKNLLNSIGFTSQNHQQNNQAPDGSDISMNCSKINEIRARSCSLI